MFIQQANDLFSGSNKSSTLGSTQFENIISQQSMVEQNTHQESIPNASVASTSQNNVKKFRYPKLVSKINFPF